MGTATWRGDAAEVECETSLDGRGLRFRQKLVRERGNPLRRHQERIGNRNSGKRSSDEIKRIQARCQSVSEKIGQDVGYLRRIEKGEEVAMAPDNKTENGTQITFLEAIKQAM